MKLLYINDELATGDGSNSHAVGMLNALKNILGENNVSSFPEPEDGSQKEVNLKIGNIKEKFKSILHFVRYFRKKILSITKSRTIIKSLDNKGYHPTYIIARSTVFDTTALYVARHYNAKLVIEMNLPTYYENSVIRKIPLRHQVEAWEKKILKKSDYIYSVSTRCADMLKNHYNIQDNKFLIVPNGYMKELYHEKEKEKNDIRERVRSIEKIDDKFVVTFLGSLKIWHGIDKFVDVAKRLENNKDIIFMVLGDGEMHNSISNYVQDHTNMIFKGKVNLNDMKYYLYASDLGIMPYTANENFYFSPLKMYDMIGAGLPFIGTNVGQISEIIKSNFNDNFLVQDNSSDLIIQRVLKIQKDELVYKSMKDSIEKNKYMHTWGARADTLLSEIN